MDWPGGGVLLAVRSGADRLNKNATRPRSAGVAVAQAFWERPNLAALSGPGALNTCVCSQPPAIATGAGDADGLRKGGVADGDGAGSPQPTASRATTTVNPAIGER